MNVYLLPGQGGDSRLFGQLQLPPEYNPIHIQYELPMPNVISMRDYAEQLLKQIDLTKPFILIGVSLGGMLVTELIELCKPEKAIIISSAKSRSELPRLYTIFRYIPLHRIIPAKFLKWSAYIAQPLVEPDRKHGKQVFIEMLNDLNYVFLKKGIRMIVEWNRKEFSPSIIHIHGNKDNTLPIRKVSHNHLVDQGSHMMVLTKGKEVSQIISSILNE